jgi:reactive intermediate/imine deaminase
MLKQKIHSSDAPEAIGPYSQAIKIENTVYLSGQIPLDPKTMQLVSDDIAVQTKQVFLNLQAVCEAAGGSLAQLVKLTIYLIDLQHFTKVNEVMTQFFNAPFPARATIQVVALPKNAQIEIDGVMVLD